MFLKVITPPIGLSLNNTNTLVGRSNFGESSFCYGAQRYLYMALGATFSIVSRATDYITHSISSKDKHNMRRMNVVKIHKKCGNILVWETLCKYVRYDFFTKQRLCIKIYFYDNIQALDFYDYECQKNYSNKSLLSSFTYLFNFGLKFFVDICWTSHHCVFSNGPSRRLH